MNRERRTTAQASSETSHDFGGASPAGLHAAALVHRQAGRLLEAQLCCERALAIDPDHADTMHLMGLLLLGAEQHDQAIEWIARAIRIEPRSDYVSNLAMALRGAGRPDDALKAFDKAASLEPDNALRWRNLGTILAELDRGDEALLSLRQALKLQPHDVDAANLSGLILYRKHRFAEALESLDASLAANPSQADALQLRALVLQNLGRLEEAAADGLRSQTLDPANVDTHNNLGYVLHRLGRHDEAFICYERALALRPDYVITLQNKADLLADCLRLDEAMACLEAARAIAPGNPITLWNIALIHMMTGNFEAGWAGREIRWKTGLGMPTPSFTQPHWSGTGSLQGKTILIFADEGIGDAFQFARYVPMLATLGARVVLAVQDQACPLLSSLPGVAECIPKSSAVLAGFDLHCSMSSLPLAFKTTLDTIPAGVPYLPSPPLARKQEWESRLGAHDRLRVGLVWSGNPDHRNDHNRSLPLRMLASILDVDAQFVSLQKDPRAADREILRGSSIVDITELLSDFVDTAALISCLDIVVSVDTSVAHLAGGLARPVWILLPYRPDYRWLLGRADSPWYPTARLFRQDERRDYRPVIARIRSELAMTAAAFRAGP